MYYETQILLKKIFFLSKINFKIVFNFTNVCDFIIWHSSTAFPCTYLVKTELESLSKTLAFMRTKNLKRKVHPNVTFCSTHMFLKSFWEDHLRKIIKKQTIYNRSSRQKGTGKVWIYILFYSICTSKKQAKNLLSISKRQQCRRQFRF